MKKATLLLLLAFLSFSSYAQLSKTKWKTTLQLQNMTDVYFDFGSDTVKVFVVADTSLLETSLFREKAGEMSFFKVSGISNCDGVTGKYKFDIRDNQMVLTLISDSCSDRAEVLDNAVMTRMR
jgi:hypothetical protein